MAPIDPRHANTYFGVGCDHREQENAEKWARWGFDYLKYDWAPCDIENAEKMKQRLLNSPRDFAFCITVSAGIEHADYWKTHCTSWQATGDSSDQWENVVKNRFYSDEWAKHVSSGHFFDMDMLETGKVIWSKGGKNALSEDEQLFSFTIRALFPSPLQISCKLERLTPFDLAMLGNSEVIAVNQDALGVGAMCIAESIVRSPDGAVRSFGKAYCRPLADHSCALALFSLGGESASFDLPLGGKKHVRDLWAQRDLPNISTRLQMTLAPHTVRLFKLM